MTLSNKTQDDLNASTYKWTLLVPLVTNFILLVVSNAKIETIYIFIPYVLYIFIFIKKNLNKFKNSFRFFKQNKFKKFFLRIIVFLMGIILLISGIPVDASSVSGDYVCGAYCLNNYFIQRYYGSSMWVCGGFCILLSLLIHPTGKYDYDFKQ